MSFTFQNLSAHQSWSVTTTIVEPISAGDFIDNQTRAGTGILTVVTRAAFGLGAVASVKFLVLSGSFVAGDQLDTNEGGTVYITGTVTATVEETILLDGTSETDSTANTSEAIDISETAWTVTSSVPFTPYEYIKIDSEYCLLTEVVNATTITVQRGRLGSAAATHTTATDIYIADKDGFKKIADESISQGWGFATISNGKIEITCALIHGRPDQTGRTVFISNFESVEALTQSHYIMGDPVYDTWYEMGVGSIDTAENGYKGYTANGSILNVSTGTVTQFMDSTYNLYGSILKGAFYIGWTANFKRTNFDSGDSLIGGAEINRIIDCYATNKAFVPGSETTEYNDVRIEKGGFFYFGSGGNAVIRDCEVIDGAIGAFFAAGTKNYIDCVVPYPVTGGANGVLHYFKYTLHLTFEDLEGSPVVNVDVRVYQKSDGALWNNATSDVNGEISEEVLRAFSSLAAGTTEYGPFRVYAQLEGWGTWVHDFDFDDQKRVDDVIVLSRSPYAGAASQGEQAV